MSCHTSNLRRPLKRREATFLLFLTLVLLASCASVPFGRDKEPKIIAIRNRSGADVAEVTLREPSRSSRAARVASIAPVPAGVTQLYIRPSDPPALPRTIAVEWVDGENRTHVKEVSLSSALRSATGSPSEALVFELEPVDDVQVFVETMPK